MRKPEPQPANPPADATQAEGRFAYEGLERTLHERARLGIVTSLAMNPGGLLFTDLKKLCDLTDGNLNRHLAVLEEHQLIEAWKSGSGPKRQTLYRLTARGRARLLDYLAELEQVVEDVARAAKAPSPSGPPPSAAPWRKASPST